MPELSCGCSSSWGACRRSNWYVYSYLRIWETKQSLCASGKLLLDKWMDFHKSGVKRKPMTWRLYVFMGRNPCLSTLTKLVWVMLEVTFLASENMRYCQICCFFCTVGFTRQILFGTLLVRLFLCILTWIHVFTSKMRIGSRTSVLMSLINSCA